MEIDYATVGGVLCGAVAGASARYGRLCSMSAIEDALVARDFRGARAWGIAVGVAALATLAMSAGGLIDLAATPYGRPTLHLLGTVVGGCLFGLGMTLVGTCSFGLLVRAGSGDLRALVSALIVGIFAFAATAGVLAPVRAFVLSWGNADLAGAGGASLLALLAAKMGQPGGHALLMLALVAWLAWLAADGRLRQRPRLISAAVLMGLGVAGAWGATTLAVAEMSAAHTESLTFVAPAGRALLQFMSVPLRDSSFGVASVLGVVAASFLMAAWRGELRWEAFDDALEMRRHLLGAALMGFGGVLARGCTVGQGLSAASTTALSAPIFVAAVLVGAHVGLKLLIEGSALWRLGFSPRPD